MTPFRGVGGKLALALLGVVAGVLGIVYLIVVPSYRASLANNELDSLSTSLRSIIPSFPAETYLKQQFASTTGPQVNARVVVFDLQNLTPALLEPVADSDLDTDSSDVENDSVAFDAIRKQTLARGLVTRSGQTYAEVAYPIGSSVVMLQSSLHDQLQVVSVVRRRVFEAGALATVFAVLLGYALASLFVRRINRLEYAANRIAAGSFGEPVVDHGSDELGQLARSFERMRLRLAQLDRARGEFIANASHELRTPLFSLGGFLELLDDPDLDEATRSEFRGQMHEQVDRLTKLATDLLDLSRLDAGRLAVVSETIDLSELADQVGAEFRRQGDDGRPPARRRPRAARAGARGRRARRPDRTDPRRERARAHAGRHDGSAQHRRRRRPGDADRGERRAGDPVRRAGAGLRALLPARGRPSLWQRPRACDCPRARRVDGRPDRARFAERLDALHVGASRRAGRRFHVKTAAAAA